MKRIGYVLAAIGVVGAAALLYFHQHRQLNERTAGAEQRAGAPEERAKAGEQHTALAQQAVDQQQRTAQLEGDAGERAAQVTKVAGEVKQTQAQNQRPAQQLEPLEKSEAQALEQDLAVMSPLKVGVVEYFMSQDRWPSSNADIGVAAPEQYHGDRLRSARVLPEGVIELSFVRGDGQTPGIVRLVADAQNSASLGIRWRCESPDFPDIVSVMPACKYTGH